MTSDNKYRNQTTCAGCGRQKDIGLVVCWDCFKYRQDVTPLTARLWLVSLLQHKGTL